MKKSQRIQSVLLAFLFFYTIFLTSRLFAETSIFNSSFKYTPQSSSLTINQTITIRISLEWSGAEDQYRFAVPSISAMNLELLRIGQSVKKNGALVGKEFEYEFKPITIGHAKIPDFKIPYTCEPACEAGFINVTGKTLQIIPERKSSALWQIWLIIFITLLALFLVAWKKLVKKYQISSVELEITNDTETRFLEELDKINGYETIQEKAAGLSKMLDRYEKEKDFRSIQLTDSNMIKDWNSARSKLETLKFSGSRINDRDYEIISHEVRSFIQKNRAIDPS